MEIDAVREAVLTGREVPEELRDDNFSSRLISLEGLARRLVKEIKPSEHNRESSPRGVVVSDQLTKSE